MIAQAAEQTDAVGSQFSAYDSLVYNLFQPKPQGPSPCTMIAFTSALPGEGVTTVIHSVFDVLGRNSAASAVQLDMDWLKKQPADAGNATVDDGAARSAWNTNWDHRRRVVHQLRSRFRYVGLDCPSLASSTDVLGLAPLVDGVVLVVEADRTTKLQMRNAERQIEAAGGTILGLILNKRRYPVPAALYHYL